MNAQPAIRLRKGRDHCDYVEQGTLEDLGR